jgi:polyphosphate kinase
MTTHAHEHALFINREVSWLAFNERVLQEAADPGVPLLERVKFAAIAASNLDEFFMVRVAGLQETIAEGDTAADLAGLTPAQQLSAVADRAHAFVAELYRIVGDELLPALAASRIRLLSFASLTEAQRVSLGGYFKDAVLPVLTPLAIDIERPFPLLSSLSLNIAVLLDAEPGGTHHRLGMVQVPAGLARLTRIAEPDGVAFVLLEDIVRAHLPQLFAGQPILEAAVVRLAAALCRPADSGGGRRPAGARCRNGSRRRGRPHAPGARRAGAAPPPP